MCWRECRGSDCHAVACSLQSLSSPSCPVPSSAGHRCPSPEAVPALQVGPGAQVGHGVEERTHPFREVTKQQEPALPEGQLGDRVLSPKDTASFHQLTMHSRGHSLVREQSLGVGAARSIIHRPGFQTQPGRGLRAPACAAHVCQVCEMRLL